MATQNLGRVRPVYQGAYDATATYVALDRMLYTDGNIYEAVTNVPTGTPPTAGQSDSYWALIGASDARITAIDNSAVHKTGNEAISGVKTFNDHIKLNGRDVYNQLDNQYLRFQSGSGFNKGGRVECFGTNHSDYPGNVHIMAVKEAANNTLQVTAFNIYPDGRALLSGQQVTTDDKAVHKTGNETISGNTTLTGTLFFKNGSNGFNEYQKAELESANIGTQNTYPEHGGQYTDAIYGAYASFCGALSTSPGLILLGARKIDKDTGVGQQSSLLLYPDGTLTWGGQQVTTDDKAVHKTGAETIAGFKTFSNTVSVKNDHYALDRTDVTSNTVPPSAAVGSGIFFRAADTSSISSLIFYDAPDVNISDGLKTIALNCGGGTGTTLKQLIMRNDGLIQWGGNKVLTGADVFLIINGPAIDTDVVLPSGGTWKYYYSVRNASNYSYVDFFSGEAAGGTNITSSFPGTSYYMRGIAIKITD